MALKYLKIFAVAIIICEFGSLMPGILSSFHYNDDVNTHYFWLNFDRGEYFLADELRRFQTIGWRLLGSFFDLLPINLVVLSKFYTLFLYAGFIYFSYRFSLRISKQLPYFPYVFIILLSIHPTIFKDISGGLPRSWSPLLQVLALNFASHFNWKQITTLVLPALFHPMSFLINFGTIGQEYLIKIRNSIKPSTLFLALVLFLVLILWLDQKHVSKLDGKVLTQRNFEAFKENHRNDHDQIRSIQDSFLRKFIENGEIEYSYVLFLKRFDLVKNEDIKRKARKFRRVHKYFVLLLCIIGIILAIKYSLIPREIVFWTVSCVILYFLAILLAWRLYAPDRYIFPLSIFLPTWFIAILLAKILHSSIKYGLPLFILYILLWGTGLHTDFYYKNFTQWKGIVNYINKDVPEHAKICGHPSDLDPIPLLAARKACINREVIQPWRPRLYERNMKLAEQAIGYVFLDEGEINVLREAEFEYLLIGKQWFNDSYLKGEERVFDKPIGEEWKHILRSKDSELLLFLPENIRNKSQAVLFEDDSFMFVDVSKFISLF